MYHTKISLLLISCLLCIHTIAQHSQVEMDLHVQGDLYFNEGGSFEHSIIGLDILHGSNDLRFQAGTEFENLMCLLPTGRLSIGADCSPEALIHLKDSLDFLITAEGQHINGSWIRLKNTGPGGSDWGFVSGGTDNFEGAGNLFFHEFGVGTHMILEAGGNLSLGGLDPNDRLDVVGDVEATGCFQTNDAGSIGGTCISDRRFKRNIRKLNNQLSVINNLRPVAFDWKDPSINGNITSDIGLIAQEVEKVVPDMVTTGDDGYKRIQYDITLQMRLISAMQEQQVIIDDQQAQIDMLRNELSDIKALLLKE